MYYKEFILPNDVRRERSTLFAILIYMFFIALLVQNTASLILIALGGIVPFTSIYIIKDILLLFIGCLLLATRVVYKFGRVDQVALLIILYVFVAVAVEGGALSEQLMHLRFYLAPIILFYLGRNLAPFAKDSDIATFILTLSALYVILGLGYLMVDRDLLLQLGMGDMLGAKLGNFGREDAMINGFPINYYFFHSNGEMTNRAFGALFDPLASAFMGSVLFFFLVEVYIRTKRKMAVMLASLVMLLILLSLTRAIIIGIVLAVLVYKFRNVCMRRSVLFLSTCSLIVAVLYLIRYDFDLSGVLDPSTVAHLNVYFALDYQGLLLGQEIEDEAVRGAESLYLTVLKEHGIVLFLLYFAWLLSLYQMLRKYSSLPCVYATIASMFVLALASLTTEHWFVFSSSALFWFMLGNNLTVAKKMVL